MIDEIKINHKIKRRLAGKVVVLIVCLIFILLLAGTICQIFLLSKKMKLIFFDVGQGDSILIHTPLNQNILIDGGPDNSILSHFGDNNFYFMRKVDWIIISHAHDDHIIGLIELIKRYKIKKLIYLDNNYLSPIFLELIAQAKKGKVEIIPLSKNAKITLGDNCYLNLYNPLLLNVPADDNNSIAVKLECQGLKFLSAGDNSAKVEEKMISSHIDLSANILKAAHHGSKTANSLEFLKKVDPLLVAISVGADNRFGHPSPEIVERIKNLSISLKRTDQLGDIKIFIDN